MLPKSLLPGKNCRGEPRSPAEKRSFSDFPKENNRIFALRRWILLWQNPRATEGRPYGYFFDKLISPPGKIPDGLFLFLYEYFDFYGIIITTKERRELQWNGFGIC